MRKDLLGILAPGVSSLEEDQVDHPSNQNENISNENLSLENLSDEKVTPLRTARKKRPHRTLFKDTATSPIVNSPIVSVQVNPPVNASLNSDRKPVNSPPQTQSFDSPPTKDFTPKVMASDPKKDSPFKQLIRPKVEESAESNIPPAKPRTARPIEPFQPKMENMKQQVESLEEIQSRMYELNLKFMDHQRVLVGQQREAVYDHAVKQMENFQEIQAKHSFWQADHLKKLRERHSEELDHQAVLETKMKRVQAIRNSRVQQSEDEDSMFVLDDSRASGHGEKRVRKVRLLHVSPKRDSLRSANATPRPSSPVEHALFKDLKEQLNSVQRDLRNILQPTLTDPPSIQMEQPPATIVTPAPASEKPVEAEPEKSQLNKEIQESINSTIHQFLQVRDKMLDRHLRATPPSNPSEPNKQQIPPQQQDTSLGPTTRRKIPIHATSAQKPPFSQPRHRGLQPAAPPSTTATQDASDPMQIYHTLSRSILALSHKKNGVIASLKQDLVLDPTAGRRKGLGGGGDAFRIPTSSLKEWRKVSGEEEMVDEDDEVDELGLEGGGESRFVNELLSGERIRELVDGEIEKNVRGGEKNNAVQESKLDPLLLKPKLSKSTLSGSVTPAKPAVAAMTKIPIPKRKNIPLEKPAPISRMPGVSFGRAGLTKPQEKAKKEDAKKLLPKAAEPHPYFAPPPPLPAPAKSPERGSRRGVSPTKRLLRAPPAQEPTPLAFDEMKNSIEKYHVTALSSKFLHSGKMIQSRAVAARTPAVETPQERREASPKRVTTPTTTIPDFYNVKLANAPVFLRRTSIRPASLQFLEGSRPDWDNSLARDGRRSTSPVKDPSLRRASPGGVGGVPPKVPVKSGRAASPVKISEPAVEIKPAAAAFTQQHEFAQTMPMMSDLGVQVSFGSEEGKEKLVRGPVSVAVEAIPEVATPRKEPTEAKDASAQYQSPTRDASAQYHTPYESSAENSRIEGAEIFAGIEFNRVVREQDQRGRNMSKRSSDAFKGYHGIHSIPLSHVPEPDLPIEITEWMRTEIMNRVLQRQRQQQQPIPTPLAPEPPAPEEPPIKLVLAPSPPKTPYTVSRTALRLLHQQVASASAPAGLPRDVDIQTSPVAREMDAMGGAPAPGTLEFFKAQMDATQESGTKETFVTPRDVLGRESPDKVADTFRELKNQLKGIFGGGGSGGDEMDAARLDEKEEKEKARLEEERAHRMEMLAELRRMREAQEVRSEQEKQRLGKEQEDRVREEIQRAVLEREKEEEVKRREEEEERRVKEMAEERERMEEVVKRRVDEEEKARELIREVEAIQRALEEADVQKATEPSEESVTETPAESSSLGISTLSSMISEGELLTHFYSDGEIIIPNVDNRRFNPLNMRNSREDDATSKDAISGAVEVPMGFGAGGPSSVNRTAQPIGKKRVAVPELHQQSNASASNSADGSGSSGNKTSKSGDSKTSAGEVSSFGELSRVEILNDMSVSEGQVSLTIKSAAFEATVDDISEEANARDVSSVHSIAEALHESDPASSKEKVGSKPESINESLERIANQMEAEAPRSSVSNRSSFSKRQSESGHESSEPLSVSDSVSNDRNNPNRPNDGGKSLNSSRDPMDLLHSLSSIDHHSFTSEEASKILSSFDHSKSSKSSGSSKSSRDAREVLSQLSHLSQSSIRKADSSNNGGSSSRSELSTSGSKSASSNHPESSDLRSDEVSALSKSSVTGGSSHDSSSKSKSDPSESRDSSRSSKIPDARNSATPLASLHQIGRIGSSQYIEKENVDLRTPLKGNGPSPFDDIVSPVSTVSPRTAATLSPGRADVTHLSESEDNF
ncbi:hypothetical protein HDU98_011732 [Podochytrium sp. JEL0797]|nr:hypothetical protein HDU98_011732 [Podochytrium sp. JEL0797]